MNKFIVFALLPVVLTLAACGKSTPPAPEPERKSAPVTAASKEESGSGLIKLNAEEARVAGLRVERIGMQNRRDTLTVTATIEANKDKLAKVAPLIAGRLSEVNAKLGDRVKPGQLLATVNSVEVGQARSSYASAQSQLTLARANFERSKRLFAEQIVAQKDYLKARAELQQAEAALREASNRLSSYRIPREIDHSSILPIIAPIAGTIMEKDAVTGELASPDKTLFTIADLSVVWIEADLAERDLSRLVLQAPAEVTVAAYPNQSFKGRVTYVSSTVNPETRTVKARIEVPNPEGWLKPNMFASAAIETGGQRASLRVPTNAIVLLQGQSTIFIAKNAGFEARAIETGETSGGFTEVKSGLGNGEAVVVSGAYALKARMLKSQIGEAE